MASPLELKKEGNRLFMERRWADAADLYTRGLQSSADDDLVLEVRGLLLSNRCQCWLNLGELQRALEDINACLQLLPSNAKAILRRATVEERLGLEQEAIADFAMVRKLEPLNHVAVESALRLLVRPGDATISSGWMRVCHSDFGTTTAGSTLHWDFSMQEVRGLAQRATRVRIQTRGRPESAVVSKPHEYPIEDIRLGRPIGFGRRLDQSDVASCWEAEWPEMLCCLWHVDGHWQDHGHHPEVCGLETNVYWAACNNFGLHWHGYVDGGYLRPLSTWMNGRDTDLELFLDVTLESPSRDEEGDVEVIVRDLAGEEVSRLRLPAHHTVYKLRESIGQLRAVSSHRIRFVHKSRGLLDDAACMRELGNPAELQLVCLPLDPEAGGRLVGAALQGDVRVVRQILHDLGDPNHTSSDGHIMSPLCVAACGGHVQVMRLLLDAGADLGGTGVRAATPVFIASMMGNVEVLRFLCELRAEVEQQADLGMTPLHAATAQGHLHVLQCLLRVGADLDRPRDDGGTALLLAVHNAHVEVARFLCGSRADVNRSDDSGVTPLLASVNIGHLAMVRLLCEAGAEKDKPSQDGSSPLLGAVTWRNVEVVRYLCGARADVNAPRHDGMNPLLVASSAGCLEIAVVLCQTGADTGWALDDGTIPILLAAQTGHLGMVDLLLWSRAEIGVERSDGWTPLHAAADGGHLDVVRLLFDRRADGGLSDAAGQTPLALASRHGHYGVAEFLRDVL